MLGPSLFREGLLKFNGYRGSTHRTSAHKQFYFSAASLLFIFGKTEFAAKIEIFAFKVKRGSKIFRF